MSSSGRRPSEVNDAIARAGSPTSTAANKCAICSSSRVADYLSAPDRFHLRKQWFHLKRCSECGCVWQINPPEPHDMSLHYDEDYHRAIAAGGETGASTRWHRQRETIARYKQEGAILDIGCSTGGFLSTMRGSAWTLYGIEMESSTAEKATQNSGAQVFVGDADQAPYGPASFDVITCSLRMS
jgi:SAM-dependent methyltransferase